MTIAVGFLLRGLAAVNGLLVAMVLTRLLGVEALGIYAFATACMAILAMPVLAGLPPLLVREAAAADVRGDTARLAALRAWANRRILRGTAGVVGLCLLALIAWPGPLGPMAWALVWALPLVPILAFGQARAALLRGLGHLGQGLLPEAAVRPAILMVALGLAFAWGGPVTAPVALGCLALAGAVAWVVGARFLARTGAARRVPGATKADPNWRAALVPLAIMAGLQSFNTNVDMVLLGVLSGPEGAGIYRVAVTVATLGLFAVTTLRIVLQPRLARLAATGRRAEQARLAQQAARCAVIAAGAALAVVGLWGVPLLVLAFGADFADALRPLLILLAGNVAVSALAMSTVLLTMSGQERGILPGLALAAGLNVALNLILIPVHGVVGAATATALAAALGQIAIYLSARARLGIDAAPWAGWSGRPAPLSLRMPLKGGP